MCTALTHKSSKHSLPLTPIQINTKLYSKYNSSNISYAIKKIDDLIYLETSLYTSKFREFLLYEEESDFFRRLYPSSELYPKLKQILLFYNKYSKIFPNYIIMNGAKYLYKNIQKKQKMINNLQEIRKQERRNRRLCLSNFNESNVIGKTTMQSVLNVTSSFYKKNLMKLFGFDNDDNNCNDYKDDIDDINKLISIIEKEENDNDKKQLKKNVVMLKPFALMEKSANIVNTSNNNINNTSKKIFIKAHAFKQKEGSIEMSSHNLNNNKTRLVLHKKILSQGLVTLSNLLTERSSRNSHNNNNIKNKILTLEVNKHNINVTNNNNQIANNMLFLNQHQHRQLKHKSINHYTTTNNSQQHSNNRHTNYEQIKFNSTNLSPINSLHTILVDKNNSSIKSKTTKRLILPSTRNNSKTRMINGKEGRNKKTLYNTNNVLQYTEEHNDNLKLTSKMNRNAMRSNLSPNEYSLKNVIKNGTLTLNSNSNTNSSKVIMKHNHYQFNTRNKQQHTQRNYESKELFNRIETTSKIKLKLKKQNNNNKEST